MSSTDNLYQNTSPKHSSKKNQKLSPNIKNQKHTLFVRKLNLMDNYIPNSRNKITKQIDYFFNSPDLYFSNDSPVTIGRKTEIEEMGINIDKIVRKRTVRSIQLKNNNNLNKSNVGDKSKANQERRTTLKTERTANNILDNPNYEIIDNSQLNDIFKSFEEKNDIHNNSFSDHENINNLPTNISIYLNY